MNDALNHRLTPVPSIPQALFNRITDEEVREVRAVQTSQTATVPIVFLALGTPFHSDTEVVHHYGLSLPAAARLARMLDKAVQEHLYGPEDQG